MEKGDRQHHAFLYWLGTPILQRERDGRADIDDDLDLLEDAFRAGWAWAESLGQEATALREHTTMRARMSKQWTKIPDAEHEHVQLSSEPDD